MTGTVSVFDLASLAPVKRINVGDYPEGIMATSDAARIVVANWESNTLTEPNMRYAIPSPAPRVQICV